MFLETSLKHKEKGANLLSLMISLAIVLIAIVSSLNFFQKQKQHAHNAEVANYSSGVKLNVKATVIDALRHFVNDQKCDGEKDFLLGIYTLDHLIRMGKIGHHSSLVSPDWQQIRNWYQHWGKSKRHLDVLNRCASYQNIPLDPDSKRKNMCFVVAYDNQDSTVLLQNKMITQNSFSNVSKDTFSVVEVGIKFINLHSERNLTCGETYYHDNAGFKVYIGMFWGKDGAESIELKSDQGVFYATK